MAHLRSGVTEFVTKFKENLSPGFWAWMLWMTQTPDARPLGHGNSLLAFGGIIIVWHLIIYHSSASKVFFHVVGYWLFTSTGMYKAVWHFSGHMYIHQTEIFHQLSVMQYILFVYNDNHCNGTCIKHTKILVKLIFTAVGFIKFYVETRLKQNHSFTQMYSHQADRWVRPVRWLLVLGSKL